MTTYDLTNSRPARRFVLVNAGAAAFARLARRDEEHRTIVQLSRMSPRLLGDMGFDPDVIYGAVDGTWDEVSDQRRRETVKV